MSAAPLQASPRGARGKFTADIARRVARGEHITLWGPRGSGKTALLHDVQRLVDARHCAYSGATRCLDDITRTLELAYSNAATRGLSRRAARGRPGWVVTCAALAAHDRYWRDGQLKARLLAGDTELSLRGASDALPPGPGGSRHGQRLAT